MSFGDSAIEALRQALALSPEKVVLRRHLAEVLAQAKRWTEAETELQEAMRIDPGDDETRLALARVLRGQRRLSESLFLLRQVPPAGPAAARARILTAQVLLDLGQREKALAEYQAALAADPGLEDPELASQLNPDPSSGRERVRTEENEGAPLIEAEAPTISFVDVGGLEGLKDEVRLKIIHPLTNPDLYAAYGKAVGGGVLLYGPPGCGKTFLARATAGEVRVPFLSVGIHDVLEMWLGQSERNLHGIFEQARAKRPCVLFFDEVDALGAKRSDLRASAGRQVINQYLAELDGIRGSNEGLLILAATNAPWHLDSALRRPGRFDRMVFVPPPDQPGRAAILRLLLRGKPTTDVDVDLLAKKTPDFSGADLKGVVDRAVEAKLREALRDGVPRPLTTRDLTTAAGQVRPTTGEWFATARNYVLYANQEGLYDDVRGYLKL